MLCIMSFVFYILYDILYGPLGLRKKSPGKATPGRSLAPVTPGMAPAPRFSALWLLVQPAAPVVVMWGRAEQLPARAGRLGGEGALGVVTQEAGQPLRHGMYLVS